MGGAPIAGPIDGRRSQTADAINQRIFETSLDLILVVDKRGQIIRVSPSSQAILTITRMKWWARSPRSSCDPEDLDSTRDEMRRARRGR